MLRLIASPTIDLASLPAGAPVAVVEEPPHAFPAAGYFAQRSCAGEGTTYIDGPLTDQQIAAIPACTVDLNAATLRGKMQTALADNATFLALGCPTNAPTLAQVKALTRQMNALARLMLGALDSTSGT